jgi:peptidoglycan-associated lipoprotein
MRKMPNIIATSLAMTLLVLAPACKSSKKNVPPPTTVPETTSAAPSVDPPPAPAETAVQQKDFVEETPTAVEETFPADIEELNRYVQNKGYIRDAFFNYDEATLDDAAQTALSTSATWLKAKEGAGYSLLVEGHCDERGTEQYNLALGDRRANTAKDYLATLGVDARRMRTVSYGEERPFEEGHDEAAMAQNRRAHLVLVRP